MSTKEHKTSQIASLVHELSGYEQRLARANADGSDELAKQLDARVTAVNEQLSLLGEEAQPRGKPVRK